MFLNQYKNTTYQKLLDSPKAILERNSQPQTRMLGKKKGLKPMRSAPYEETRNIIIN